MEDSFRVRADKIFGALGGDTTSSAGVSPSLWCLGDEEIERREWNRHKDYADEGVDCGPSDLGIQLESDLKELSDNEEAEEEVEDEEEEEEEIDGGKKKRRRSVSSGGADSGVDEYLDVQSNIGRDCTLDFEEEEDQYDKVAVGAENAGDRLYMRDVKFNEYGIEELNEFGELPNSLHAVVRDPRANHTAAKIRLKEDAEAAGNFDNLQLSDNSATTKAEADSEDLKKGELDGENLKPILKKRDSLMDSRSQKRVRFVFDPKSSTQTHDDQPSSGGNESALDSNEHPSDLSLYSAGVPDYLRNPSNYTRYTFDSSDDVDDQSNRKAYMEFFDNLRKRNTDSSMDEDDSLVETPKSVVFMPRRKMEEDLSAKRSERECNFGDNVKNKRWSVGITAEDSQESEVSTMEEDEPCRAVDEGRSSGRPGRKYRARTNVDVDDSSN